MTFSIYEDTGDDIQTQFNYPFEFIDNEDIFVFVDGVEQTITIDYTMGFDTSNFILFNVAPGNTLAIKIQRNTPISVLESEFANTSILDAEQLNLSNKQTLYKIQEITDLLLDNIQSFVGNNQMNQDLDMNGFRVVELADAIADTDALNYKQAQDLIATAEAPIIQQTVDGEGYQIGQTALSGTDLTALVGFEFIAFDITKQIAQASYPEFDTATGGAYDIGGGILEIPGVASPDANQKYYMRLK